MERMFSKEELSAIAEPPSNKALKALNDSDIFKLNGFLGEMVMGPVGTEALGLDLLTRFFGEFRKDFGEKKAKELLERMGSHLMRSFADDYKAGKEKDVIADLLAVFMHQTGGNLVSVTETADEVVYALSPCGSGGRFMLNGSIQKMPDWYGPWSDTVSSYCQACKADQRAFNKAVGMEAWITEISPDVPGRCLMRFQKNKTKGRKLFSGTELYANVKTKMQMAKEKIAGGDLNIADLIKNQQFDWRPWHDFLVAMIGYAFAICYIERGADYLKDKQEIAYDSVFTMFYPVYEALNDEQNLQALCNMHHYHFMTFTLTEEKDRFAFRLDPCGSGGRIFRGQMWRDVFKYGGELSPLMKEPHVTNFYRKDFPVYCTHCSSHNRDQFRTNHLWFINDGHAQMEPGMPCVQYYYKKAKGIQTAQVDQKLLRQVGL